jgi:small GTP-binding protein
MITRKMIMIGMRDAGKTSLVRRVVLRTFDTDYLSTMGVDIYTHTVPAARLGEGAAQDVRLTVWDTQGQIDKRIFKHPYFQGSSAIGIVGDAADRPSLERMVELALICDVEAAGRPCLLLCNKIDLLQTGQEPDWPANFDPKRWPLFKTSAREDVNVTEAFEYAARAVLRRGL